MIKSISSIIIWSENYKELAQWYKEKFNFTIGREFTHPQDSAIEFSVGSTHFWIGKHSQVKGKNKDKFRFMLNFLVDSVLETYEELKSKGVVFLKPPFKAPTMEKYFATFYDLDGNLLQIVGEK